MISARYSTVLNHLLVAASIITIGAFLICQINDLDIWWHLAIGRDILTRHTVPMADHFTAAAFGRPYHDSQWLFQVVMALADKAAGMVGVQAMMILGWSAVFWFCYRSITHWVSSPVNYLLLFLAAMASSERFIPRPEVTTLLMIVIFWWMLQQRRYESTKGLLLFSLLQVIWTNSHGLFVIGPFMAGCYWFAALLQRKHEESQQGFTQLSKLLGILFVTTLATPYGWGGWRFAMQIFTETGPWAPDLFRVIEELSPTFGAATRNGIAFWFLTTLLATTILTTIPIALHRQISIARLLIVAGLLAATMTGRRNMPLFALVAAPFIAENLRLLFPQGIIKSIRIKTVATAILLLATLGLAWYPLSGAYYINNGFYSRFGLGATPSFYPYNLPEILKQTRFNGQIYNSNLLGGFYLYHGYPKQLPLMDGRFEIYDPGILERIYNAPYNQADWAWMVDTYNIRGLLLHHTSIEAEALLPALRLQDVWRLVYYDHTISFWMRSDIPGLPPAVDLKAAMLPPGPAQLDDCIMLNFFFSLMDVDGLKLQNLQRATEFNWNMENLLTEIGQTQIRLQRFDQAENTFKHLLHDHPRNLHALNELTLLAERRGDLETAESLLRRALEIAPDDPDLRGHYFRISRTAR